METALTLILSILAGVLLHGFDIITDGLLSKLIKKTDKKAEPSYRERMVELSKNLTETSSKFDKILNEMTEASNEREKAVSESEGKVRQLSTREKELKEQINSLENVSFPAVQYFLGSMEKGEKRSALRDYALFGLGVLVSIGFSILLKLFNI